MSKQQLQWTVERTEHGGYRAMLWTNPYVKPLIAMTRWTTSKAQARKDGRKVFAQFGELKDA